MRGKEISTTVISNEKVIEESRPILASYIKNKMKIKKIELQQELVDITPPEAKWKETKPGKRRTIISE